MTGSGMVMVASNDGMVEVCVHRDIDTTLISQDSCVIVPIGETGAEGSGDLAQCYNPFSSSFHFALYSFSPFTHLERKTPFLHKYFLSFDSYFFFLLFP